MFQIAKQRNKNGKDVQQVKVVKSECGEVLVEERRVQQRWREYIEDLLSQENPREREKRSLCTEDNEGGGGNNRRRSENSIKENEKKEKRGNLMTSRWKCGLSWEISGLDSSQN